MRMGRSALASLSLLLAGCGATPSISPPPPIEEAQESPQESAERPAHPLVVATSTAHIVTGPTSRPPVRSCNFDPASHFGSTCHVVFPSKVTATTSWKGVPENAFDGSTCSVWNAGGFAPASLTVDLGAATDIDALVLLPEMTPSGNVVHRVEMSDDGVTFTPSQRIEAPMQSGVEVDLRLPSRERARFVRFTTDASPSWVAWQEIAIVTCGPTRTL